MGRIKELWRELTTSYEEEMKYYDAIEMVCRKCKFGIEYCSLCPVELSRVENDQKHEFCV